MSGIAEIKHRIASVRDTKKITNAMYLIASTKVRKAKNDLERTLPYFSALQGEIADIFAGVPELDSVYFDTSAREEPRTKGGCGILVITADKGLAGAYNANVLKRAQELLREHPDNRLFVVGEYGRQYYKNHGVPFVEEFDYTAQDPTLHRAREICDILLPKYESGELDEIFVVYTDFGGGRSEHVYAKRLLPIELLGILLSVAGALFLVSKGQIDVLLHISFNKGDLLFFTAQLGWAVYSLTGFRVMRHLPPLTTTAWAGLF